LARIDWRAALKAPGVLAGAAALESCAAKHLARARCLHRPRGFLRVPKVNVQAGREIRPIAGLRPFRPSSFVVSAQKFFGKLVVHNHGHGGRKEVFKRVERQSTWAIPGGVIASHKNAYSVLPVWAETLPTFQSIFPHADPLRRNC